MIGPVPGDTVFVKLRAGQYDAVVAMYHDQGHIPVKLLGFDVDPATGKWDALSGVNITLGLPIIRTSVDHGTAFDIAGKGIASERSLIEAIEYAEQLAAHRAPDAEPAEDARHDRPAPPHRDRPSAAHRLRRRPVGSVGEWAAAKGVTRSLVVADAFNAARVALLGLPGEVTVFGEVKPEPDIPNLAGRPRACRARTPDLVVGFGGGSAMDLAKLVAVLPGSGQSIHDVVGPEKVNGRRCALVQVPTTSGTGSEAGTRALVTDPATQNKLAVQSRHMLADLAVVDPDLTATVPPRHRGDRRRRPGALRRGLHQPQGASADRPLRAGRHPPGRPLPGARRRRRQRPRGAGRALARLALWRLLPRPGEHHGGRTPSPIRSARATTSPMASPAP